MPGCVPLSPGRCAGTFDLVLVLPGDLGVGDRRARPLEFDDRWAGGAR